MTGRFCKTCLFFDSQIHGCRRHPPTVLILTHNDQPSASTHWPGVGENDWCGEYFNPKDVMNTRMQEMGKESSNAIQRKAGTGKGKKALSK